MEERSSQDSAAAGDTPAVWGQGARRQRRRARLVFAAGLTCLALWVAWDYLSALAWAAVIAMAAWPLFSRFAALMPERRRRTIAPLLFTALACTLLLAALTFAAVEVGREAQTASHWLAEAQRNGIPVPEWLVRVPLLGSVADAWWRAHLGGPNEIRTFLGGFDQAGLTAWSQAAGGQLAHRALLLLLTAMALFSLLHDGAWLAERAFDLADRALGGPGERLASELAVAVRGTVNGTVLVALGEGLLIGTGYVVAGVPHAVLLCALTVACAMVPLGAWIAFGAASLLILAEGGGWLAAAGLFGFGAAVMLVGDNLVQPALIGGAARLPFLWALIGILGGLASFGLVGLFLGPVVTAALLIVWREWPDRDLPAPKDARTPCSD